MKSKKVILVTGYDRCGKDYLADKLANYLDADIAHLADPLKDIVCDMLDLNREELEELKNNAYSLLDIGYGYNGRDRTQTLNFRKFIIKVGTILRKNVGEYIFIEAIKNIIKESNKDYVIIPDVRFLIEYKELSKSFNTFTIKLDSELDSCGRNDVKYEVDKIPYDYIFKNTEDIIEFAENLKNLIEKIKGNYEKGELNEWF